MTETVMATIRHAFAQDAHCRVTELDQVPSSYDDMTPEWLTKVLCAKAAGATVTGFRLDERDDGSSNRRRIFLTYNDVGAAAGLPETVFCKAADTLHSRIVLGVSNTARAEANFYNKVRDRVDFEAPRVHFAGFDPKTYAYLIMMEDLAGRVQFPDERQTLTHAQAISQVTTLARFHASFYQSPELGSETLPFQTWPAWWADMMSGAPTFPACCDTGFRDAQSVIPSRLFARRAEIWPATEKSVARHANLPQTLIHSDVHLKNWYITAQDELGLGDWQLVTIGHWSRDYAFATTTSLTVDQRRAWGEELLRTYIAKMQSLGVPPIDYDDALLNVRQQLFTALAFWTITLRPTADMPDMQPERTTYEFLRRLTTAIDDLDALDAFQ